LWRWFATFRRHLAKARQPAFAPSVAGERDPLVRPDAAVVRVPGAHAMHFSHPDATADAVLAFGHGLDSMTTGRGE
jgi:hypothetical protein